ncbi:IclR family transcriptional regulator [Nocardioides sp. JQ2195]|nr:IclR family transcriptional regulator [Nocardioides sp. JQ2195]
MVERMTLILDAFDDRSVRLRLDEIAASSGLPRSTCHRILEQLLRLGWLRHTQGGYALGQRALQLGGVVSDHSELRSAVVPLLEELHAQTGRIVHLGVLDFADVVYLDRIGGASAASLPSRVGGRAPAHAVGLGKAMLAWLSPEEADTLLEDGMKARTRNTITDLLVMHEELRRIRGRHGLAFERDEYVPGISCVGAAIRGPEGVVAGISLCGDSGAGPLERYAPLVLDVARRASRRMFPRSSPEDMPSTVWSDGMMERILTLIDDDALM